MDRGRPRIKKGKHSFSFQDFFKLINQVHPKYWQLVVGTLAGLIATEANLIVPQFAQRIINNFKHLNINLVIITGIVFFGGVIIVPYPAIFWECLESMSFQNFVIVSGPAYLRCQLVILIILRRVKFHQD